MTPLLEFDELSVEFDLPGNNVRAVRGLNLELSPGECLGIVGESGSGKSQSLLAAMGLLARNGRATGSVRLRGEQILNAPESRLRSLRGKDIAMVFQDSLSGLTPNIRVGRQLEESLLVHSDVSRAQARERALELLRLVKIPEPAARLSSYPFELSGGMRQRVMIALALMCKPDVLLCDEPTTALDVTVQAQVIKLLRGLRDRASVGIVFVTHDLGVVAGLCDRVLVMYAGRAVEVGSVETIFSNPKHPYTRGLLASVPRLDADPDVELTAVPGLPPDLAALPAGCPFQTRCELVESRCTRDEPPLRSVGAGRAAACHVLS